MLLKYAGYDSSERQIVPRSASSRFSETQIAEMRQMAGEGASGVEIAKALGLKPAAVRSKCWALGVRLRQRTLKSRIRMVIDISKRLRAAADARGLSPPALIRRLISQISKLDMFDEILGPMVPHSLGAAATYEPAAGRAGRAAVADAGSSVAAATFAVVLLRTPQLGGCCARLG
jgi:hypothetical protein